MKELGKFAKQEETLVLGLEVKDKNHPLNDFIGKTVRFKPEFIEGKGNIRKRLFYIGGIQKNWEDKVVLRGFSRMEEDVFGMPINPEEVEVI